MRCRVAYGRAKPDGKYGPEAAKLMDQVREVLRYHHFQGTTISTSLTAGDYAGDGRGFEGVPSGSAIPIRLDSFPL